KRQRTDHRDSLEYQLEERARVEEEQEREDERLWQQHQAAKYRDWEWWLVDNCPRPRSRRLQTTLVMAQAGAAEQVTCSVPLARNRPIELQLRIQEVADAQDDESVDELASSALSTEEAYRAWRGGGLTDDAARTMVGEDMMGMFMAQRMVKEDPGHDVGQAAEASQGSGMQPLAISAAGLAVDTLTVDEMLPLRAGLEDDGNMFRRFPDWDMERRIPIMGACLGRLTTSWRTEEKTLRHARAVVRDMAKRVTREDVMSLEPDKKAVKTRGTFAMADMQRFAAFLSQEVPAWSCVSIVELVVEL
ncbi:unnamed protein product, partial [Symbiodinium microadriaticum]